MIPQQTTASHTSQTSNMPTQTPRPFFSNFLAAFRAHSAIQQSKAPSPSTTTTTSHTSSHHTSPSQPRTITTSTKQHTGATTTALTSIHSPRRNPSPGTSPGDGKYLGSSRGRRGSDSSSEGFRDVLGQEKWYVGGRTAGGEERYFKLGVVRRQRSGDRLSLDRLSL